MFRGIGFDLGTVQTHLTHFHQPHFLGNDQYLDKKRFQLVKKTFTKYSNGVMVGMIVGGNKPERDRIISRLLKFTAGKYTGGISIEKQAQ